MGRSYGRYSRHSPAGRLVASLHRTSRFPQHRRWRTLYIWVDAQVRILRAHARDAAVRLLRAAESVGALEACAHAKRLAIGVCVDTVIGKDLERFKRYIFCACGIHTATATRILHTVVVRSVTACKLHGPCTLVR